MKLKHPLGLGRVIQAGMLLKPLELEPEFGGPNKPHGATSPYEPIKRAILIEKSKKRCINVPPLERRTDRCHDIPPPQSIVLLDSGTSV